MFVRPEPWIVNRSACLNFKLSWYLSDLARVLHTHQRLAYQRKEDQPVPPLAGNRSLVQADGKSSSLIEAQSVAIQDTAGKDPINARARGWIVSWLTEALLRRVTRGFKPPQTDTLAQAVDALRSTKSAERIAAIRAIERIARNSAADHWIAVEALTAYLRHRAPWPANEAEVSKNYRADIQAAILVLGRRCLSASPEEAAHALNLRHLDLRGIRLRRGQGHLELAMLNGSCLARADLRRAQFWNANFHGADLSYANLTGANLRSANLQYAVLCGANLTGADLSEAALMESDLRGATLRGARLTYARLRGADLTNADLRGAGLRDAELFGKGLTCQQLTQAANWPSAYREEHLACGRAIPLP